MESRTGCGRFVFWAAAAAVGVQAGMAAVALRVPSAQPISVLFLCAAAAMLGWGLFREGAERVWHRTATEALFGAILAAGILDLPWGGNLPRRLLGNPPDALLWLVAGAAALGTWIAIYRANARLRLELLLLLLLVAGARSWSDILRYPDEEFDVLLFHRFATERLLEGGNPYRGPIPLAATADDTRDIYDPALLRDGKVAFGYPYPPVSLLAVLPGHLIAGDYRASLLLALLASAGLLYYWLPDRLGAFAAGALALGPATRFLLFFGWTELLSGFLALAMLGGCLRFPAAAPYLFGLFVSSKQSIFVLVPSWALTLREQIGFRQALRWLAIGAAVSLIIALPFYLAGPSDYQLSVVTLQIRQPMRMDSLSLGPLLFAKSASAKLALSIASVLLFAGTVLAGWRKGLSRRGLEVWCGWAAMQFFGVFLVNKQAFANYYYPAYVLLLAACVLGSRPETGHRLAPIGDRIVKR